MKLINAKACKEFALNYEKSRFPRYPKLARTRISKQFLEACDTHLEVFIRGFVMNTAMGKGSKTI